MIAPSGAACAGSAPKGVIDSVSCGTAESRALIRNRSQDPEPFPLIPNRFPDPNFFLIRIVSLAPFDFFAAKSLRFFQREGRIQSAERAVPTFIGILRLRTSFSLIGRTPGVP
jgi:hypothetical protein